MTVDNSAQKDYWAQRKNARAFDHPIVAYFARQRIQYLRECLGEAPKSAFDVGCGDGFSTYYTAEWIPSVRGGDGSETMLDHNPAGRHRLQVIDAENLPLEDRSSEMVYCWEVLHHLNNPQRAVSEMARVCSKYVVLFEPNRANLLQLGFGLVKKEERGTWRSSRRYLAKLCSDAGLTVIRSDYVGHIVPNMLPSVVFPLVQKLPFRSNILTAFSIAVIASKGQ